MACMSYYTIFLLFCCFLFLLSAAILATTNHVRRDASERVASLKEAREKRELRGVPCSTKQPPIADNHHYCCATTFCKERDRGHPRISCERTNSLFNPVFSFRSRFSLGSRIYTTALGRGATGFSHPSMWRSPLTAELSCIGII